MIGLVWNAMMSFGGGWFFLAASEAISKAPELATARLHEKVQAAAVGELQWLVRRNSFDDRELRKWHDRTRTVQKRTRKRTRIFGRCHVPKREDMSTSRFDNLLI